MDRKGEIIVTILWKIYFCVMLGLLLLIGDIVILKLIQINPLSKVYDILIVSILIFGLLALYGYVFNKKYFSKEIWKFIFLLLLIESTGDLIDVLLDKNYASILEMSIFIPYFYALYKYAFQSEKAEVPVDR